VVIPQATTRRTMLKTRPMSPRIGQAGGLKFR
jgi:hypothetical protein